MQFTTVHTGVLYTRYHLLTQWLPKIGYLSPMYITYSVVDACAHINL